MKKEFGEEKNVNRKVYKQSLEMYTFQITLESVHFQSYLEMYTFQITLEMYTFQSYLESVHF